MAFVNSELTKADNLYIKEFLRKFLIRVCELDSEYFLKIDDYEDIYECISYVIDDFDCFTQGLWDNLPVSKKRDFAVYRKASMCFIQLAHFVERELSSSEGKIVWSFIRKQIISVLKHQGEVTVPRNNSFNNAETKISKYLGIDRQSLDFLTVYAIIARKREIYGLLSGMDLDKNEKIEEFSFCLGFSAEKFRKISNELFRMGFLDNVSDDFNHRLSDKIIETYDPFIKSDPSKWFEKLECNESLKLEDFQIEEKFMSMIKRLLSGSMGKNSNILLYGEPGTGKTTLVKALAHELNLTVFSVSSGEDDDDRDRRLSLAACVNFAKRYKNRPLVLVDEAERLLSTDNSYDRCAKDKAWLNSFLEKSDVSIIWITNQISHVDPAVRRRFDFSLYFPKLNKKQQQKIWEFVLKKYDIKSFISSKALNTLNEDFEAPVSVIDKSVFCAKTLCGESKKEFASILRTQLESYVSLREDGIAAEELKKSIKKKKSDIPRMDDYSTDAVNFNCDINRFIEGFKKLHETVKGTKRPEKGIGTILFYGPPGTGKTELGHYLAKITKRKAVIKKASDLLNCFVGMSEKLVAETFNNLDIKKEILIIDEVDSFLYDRSGASHSWEKTLVNEFLTQLQEFRGILICTTNLVKGLDPAVMRRFTTKLEFKYSEGKQLDALYESLLKPLSKADLSEKETQRLHKIKTLTPGDFHVVKGKFISIFSEKDNPSNDDLLKALEQETGFKDNKTESGYRRIGFI